MEIGSAIEQVMALTSSGPRVDLYVFLMELPRPEWISQTDAKGDFDIWKGARRGRKRKAAAAYSPRLAKPRHLPLISNPKLAELGKMLLYYCPTVFLNCL